MIPNDLIYHSNEPLELITANGSQSADQQASIHIDCINKEVHPYVLPDTPAVISVGMRCIQDGWDFVYQLVIADRAHQKAALRVMWNHPRLLSPEALAFRSSSSWCSFSA